MEKLWYHGKNYGNMEKNEGTIPKFGASKRHTTLHTGVYRYGESEKSVSFCSVPDSLEHGPAAIWTHKNLSGIQ